MNYPRSFFRIPPFPGAKGNHVLLRKGDQEDIFHANEWARTVAQAQIGGNFWGSWPTMPDDASHFLWPTSHEQVDVMIAALEQPGGTIGALAIRKGYGGKLLDAGYETVVEVPDDADPWYLARRCVRHFIDAGDERAPIAALSGRDVQCFGTQSDAFLSLNDADDQASAAANLLHEAGMCSDQYTCPFTQEPLSVAELVVQLGAWRKLIDSNRDIAAAVGFAFWKQETTQALLWGGSPVNFTGSLDGLADGASVASWSSRAPTGTDEIFEQGALKRIEVEDGFIRSTGLGADCVPPLSIIVDRRGIYFDPGAPSDLEHILETADFSGEEIEQARALRRFILATGVSKYAVDRRILARPGGENRRHVLVTGQVEDDRSVLRGGGLVRTNLQLLEAARALEPDAFIIFKPHPDVEAGHRAGIVPDREAVRFADHVERAAGITSLIDMADSLHVMTSLAGFEALLREKTVVTHGTPFYAGWGLTQDMGAPSQRRTRRRTLDELVAAALLVYPRYLDPVTRLPCPPDILVRRLSEGEKAQNNLLVAARRVQGLLHGKLSWLKGRVQ